MLFSCVILDDACVDVAKVDVPENDAGDAVVKVPLTYRLVVDALPAMSDVAERLVVVALVVVALVAKKLVAVSEAKKDDSAEMKDAERPPVVDVPVMVEEAAVKPLVTCNVVAVAVPRKDDALERLVVVAFVARRFVVVAELK